MRTQSEAERNLDRQILACTTDLNRYLPELAQRYSPVVVIGALATHVGGGLKVFIQSGICTPAQARVVLQRLERVAFDPTPADTGPVSVP